MTDLRIGTSALTAAGWESAFYPPGMKAADYLTYYATKFNLESPKPMCNTPRMFTLTSNPIK